MNKTLSFLSLAIWFAVAGSAAIGQQAATSVDGSAAAHWSWQPLTKPGVPGVADNSWPANPIDRFILVRLEQAGIRPAPPAPPAVLIRRLHLDLLGIIPDPRQVERFELDYRRNPDRAIARTADRLLHSPQYGERWGRHWLDVARYSDGHGGFLDNTALLHAWRFRDWVVGALNADLPFDEFLKRQIAGDLLDGGSASVATGFLALGPVYRSDGGDPDSVAQAKSETLDDRVDTFSRAILALTVACARCHEHKFDPIPQMDYYSIAGVFNNTTTGEVPLAPARVVQKYDSHQREILDATNRIKALAERLKKEKPNVDSPVAHELAGLKKRLERLRTTLPPKYPVAHALRDTGSEDMRIALRGNLRDPGEVAPRRFLRLLSGQESARFSRGSGRLELAEAVGSKQNPLPARVFVNRVWMHHFSKAIVRTPNNFGSLGAAPTHPELLDWLASELIDEDWSIKRLHYLIVTSSAYRMSSQFNRRAFELDGDNELVWRMEPRRMDIEAWRDSILSATGELDSQMSGPAIDRIDHSRRTLYFKVSRNGDQFASDELLRLFDFPIMRATVAKRTTSIVPQQYLFMLNSDFMIQRATKLADRILRDERSRQKRIELAYRLLYGRGASNQELALGREFLGGAAKETGSDAAWKRYCQVLLSSNEFMFIQ